MRCLLSWVLEADNVGVKTELDITGSTVLLVCAMNQ